MAIGLGGLRAVGRRAGRAAEERGPERTTVREVCLIGLDRRASAGDWTAGQEITWLGRKYQVVAPVGDVLEAPPACDGGADPRLGGASARQYVHLTPRDGN
jgi:hypothetical protein